jgi:hypothetical protein
MSKILLLSFLIFDIMVCFSQNTEPVNGRKFLKRVENNFINNAQLIFDDGKVSGFYNFDSKTDMEKLFFGDFNASLDFFVRPSFEGAYGFRIVQDSLDNYLLETKRISNWGKIEKELESDFPLKGIPGERISTVPGQEIDANAEYNREIHAKRNEERLKSYEIATQSFPVTQEFANKLQDAVSAAIHNFKEKGRPEGINGGYTVTFRCVVEDELWTLTVRMPNGYIGKLTDICKLIIKDAETNDLDESKYIPVLINRMDVEPFNKTQSRQDNLSEQLNPKDLLPP